MSERLRECIEIFKKLYREEGPAAAARWWKAVLSRDPALNAEWNRIVDAA